MTEFSDLLKERRLARMRMGQSVCEIVELVSDPEMQVALVPLTEEEYEQGITVAVSLNLPDNDSAFIARDRYRQLHDMWCAARLTNDYSIKAFSSPEEMSELLEDADVNVLSERYLLMRDTSSPSIDGLSDDDLSELKKAFAQTNWSELSGRQWVAVKTCLSILLPDLLQVKLLGSTSTSSLTQTSDELELTSSVVPS